MKFPKRAARPSLCPHLGLASEPLQHHSRVSDEHRCYANLGRERIDLAHQRRYCLASCYSSCPFLTVEQKGVRERIWTWVRVVSPIPQVQPGAPRRLGGSPWAHPALARLRLPWRQLARKVVPLLRDLNPLVINFVLWAVERLASMRQPAAHAEATAECEQVPQPEPAPAIDLDAPTELVATVGDAGDLIEAGINAIEDRDEAAAYALFKQATQTDADDPRAWFWRAKTADTLDEVIACLERALTLEPSSTQIKANLDWAVQRREQERGAQRARKSSSAAEKAARAYAPRRPRARERLRGLGLEVTRCLTAVAAFGIGAAWLLSALPADVRQTITTATDMRILQVPDAAAVFAQLPMPVLGDGYRTATALPYGLGFLAEFVGFGLLSSQGWTRAWAPVVGLLSAWLWLHAGAGWPSQLVLLGCAIVASGSVLAAEPQPKSPIASQV